MRTKRIDVPTTVERIALNRKVKYNLTRIQKETCPWCDRRNPTCFPCRMTKAVAQHSVVLNIDITARLN